MSFWHAECSQNARCKLNTSGVVQPPLHASAALCVYRRASNAEGGLVFLEEMYPRLVAWHEYLYRERDPEGEGLAYIRHPWESGMDNSPMWDAILQRMQLRPDQIPKYQRADTHVVPKEDRPEEAAYDRFAYLVQLFEQRDYEEVRIREDCPFLVQDVLFNVLLCQAEQDLAQIAQILGEDSSPHEARAAKTAGAIDRKLWDEDTGSTSNSTWSPASLLAYTLPQASSPCTLEFPMESEPSVCSRAWRTRGSVSRMKARYPSPATTATATGSHPCGTGGVRFGSTSTGC